MNRLDPLALLADAGPDPGAGQRGVRGLLPPEGPRAGAAPTRSTSRSGPSGTSSAKPRRTRFGRDHGFSRGSTRVDDYQAAGPAPDLRGPLGRSYLQDRYPGFENLTWPGLIPYLATTSGTTAGTSKYIPVTRAMLASNRKAARTMIAYHLASRPDSRLFRGKLFMLGGSTALDYPSPGVGQGDLSAITAHTITPPLRPYSFPPLDLALDPQWDRKLTAMAERSLTEPITLVSGVTSVLLSLFRRLIDLSGRSTIAEVWPGLEVVVHGGVKFDPYREATAAFLGDDSIRVQESYPCSEGFIAFGDRETGLLRLVFDHGIFYEFVPDGGAGLGAADEALAGKCRGRRELRDRGLDLRGPLVAT